jgi:DNA-binding LacI/PurR family transcriptional regulator
MSKRTPLYKQIRKYVLNNISQNHWKPNDRIPSENELAAQFKVSRITIKNALQELIDEGIIYRIQGKGSFVAANRSGEPLVYQSAPFAENTLVAYLMPRLDNRFTANLLNGIENGLAAAGYYVMFCETHDQLELEKELLRKMVRLQVKGIIIYPVQGQTYNEEILKLTLNRFPVVVVDRYLRGIETNCVCADNMTGAYDAVTHLIGMGHRHIGFVSTGYEGTSSLEDRLGGYEKALTEHLIPIDHRLRLVNLDGKKVNTIFQTGEADAESKEEIKSFLRQNAHLTGVIAANSAVGLTLTEAVKEMSLRIPEDLSVVFLDDYELSAFSRIPPTCVSQEELTVGKEAAKLLVSLIEKPDQERKKILIPTQLIVRQSTGPAKITAENR